MEKRESFAQAISQILAKHSVITEAEGRALQRSFKNSQKENFDDFLLEEGLVEEVPLLRALAEYYQVPSIDVTGYFFDNQLLRNFPKDYLVRNRIIPLEIEDDILTVVASEPDNPDLLSTMGAYTSEDIQFRVGLARDIIDAVREFYDKSDTQILDDQDYDPAQLEEEKLENKEQYHKLLDEAEQEEELGSPIKRDIDEGEEE